VAASENLEFAGFQSQYNGARDSLRQAAHVCAHIDEKNLTVQLHRTHESIVIPVRRVVEVLDFGDRELPILLLNGRMQWITTTRRWRFRQEEADPDSLLGIHKDTTQSDARVKEICEHLRKQDFQPGWAYEHEVPSQFSRCRPRT
jgi:hypothetical protein